MANEEGIYMANDGVEALGPLGYAPFLRPGLVTVNTSNIRSMLSSAISERNGATTPLLVLVGITQCGLRSPELKKILEECMTAQIHNSVCSLIRSAISHLDAHKMVVGISRCRRSSAFCALDKT